MLKEITYDRQNVVEYAKMWATKRNPRFFDFDGYGGDCTNYASQCVFAGCNVMNYTPVMGWFFISSANRSPSWSGVEFFHNFLILNTHAGPYGKIVDINQVEIGDIIQLQDALGDYYHSLVVTDIINGEIYISAHSNDAYNKPLKSYYYHNFRCIHISGARQY